jgi:GT2 family glycosyltransferase
MRVLSGTLAEMVGFMRNHPEAAVGGCHLVDEEGKMVRHARRFPGVWDQATIILKVPHFFPKILDKYLMADFDYAKMEPQEVDSLRGSFFMIRHEAIAKIGPLDERYFFWFEEVDFCRRARAAGYKILYNGAVKCIDLVGQSVKTLGQYKRQKMFLESMVKYFRKWYPGWRAWLIGVLRPIGLAMAWAADKYRSAARVS